VSIASLASSSRSSNKGGNDGDASFWVTQTHKRTKTHTYIHAFNEKHGSLFKHNYILKFISILTILFILIAILSGVINAAYIYIYLL
jgi:hypothetical protein